VVLNSYTLDGVHVRASASEVVVDVTLRGSGGLRIKVTRGDSSCQLLFLKKLFQGFQKRSKQVSAYNNSYLKSPEEIQVAVKIY